MHHHACSQLGLVSTPLATDACADQRRYWAGEPSEYRFISADEIAEAFYSTTEAGRAIKEVGGGGGGKATASWQARE